MTSQNKTKVLFLCTDNSARSQMAEAYLRHYAGERYEAHSAGLDPKGINPYTMRIMAEAGVRLDGQTAHEPFWVLATVLIGATWKTPPLLWAAKKKH